jgi:hypothetical protein
VVDAVVRERVRQTQRRAFELQLPVWQETEEELLVPDVAGRLGVARAPTLVVGEQNVADVHQIATQLVGRSHCAQVWAAVSLEQVARFADLDLHGPHDLRHTFATWLEDASIPSRVIDEVMGHSGGRHPEQGSRMGRVYRETTPEMRRRVVAAVEERLAVVLKTAAAEAADRARRGLS